MKKSSSHLQKMECLVVLLDYLQNVVKGETKFFGTSIRTMIIMNDLNNFVEIAGFIACKYL